VSRPLQLGVVAGEASGDMLGARVIEAFRIRYPDLAVRGVGGPAMEAAGLYSHFPLERLAVNGLVEPLRRLPELLSRRADLLRMFRASPPDIFLSIDAPDFNLWLARNLRASGVPTAHLVSPSVWAWRKGRLRGIASAVDMMLCLFPFETDIYRQYGIPVRCVGHPLADELSAPLDRDDARRELDLAGQGPVLALLPGSRAAEVAALAPVFLRTARLLRAGNPGLAVLIPASSRERRAQLEVLVSEFPDLSVTLLDGSAKVALAAADAVLVAAGTATLEAALLQRPMVVAYKMHAISWAVLSRLVRTAHVALPNLLAGREVVAEFLQDAATPQALAGALSPMLRGDAGSASLQEQYQQLAVMLRLNCAQRVASVLDAMARGVAVP
jgi:lipid-A-disaccharide synthase